MFCLHESTGIHFTTISNSCQGFLLLFPQNFYCTVVFGLPTTNGVTFPLLLAGFSLCDTFDWYKDLYCLDCAKYLRAVLISEPSLRRSSPSNSGKWGYSVSSKPSVNSLCAKSCASKSVWQRWYLPLVSCAIRWRKLFAVLSEQLKEMVLIGIFLSTFISETSFRTMEVLVSGFPSVNIYTAVMSGSSKAILSASSVQVLPEAVNLEDHDTALWYLLTH